MAIADLRESNISDLSCGKHLFTPYLLSRRFSRLGEKREVSAVSVHMGSADALDHAKGLHIRMSELPASTIKDRKSPHHCRKSRGHSQGHQLAAARRER